MNHSGKTSLIGFGQVHFLSRSTSWLGRAARIGMLNILILPPVATIAAQAGELLYGNLTWAKDGPPNRVSFTLTAGFRRSDYAGTASDGHPQAGDIIPDSTSGFSLDV